MSQAQSSASADNSGHKFGGVRSGNGSGDNSIWVIVAVVGGFVLFALFAFSKKKGKR